MDMTLGTARIVAPAAYVFNFICQIYGMKSTPNMLDIHNKHPSATSPNPWFIPAFFNVQQIFQVWWLVRLWKDTGVSNEERKSALQYAPIFSLGNACIGVWMVFWNADRLDLSMIPVAINTASHLYAVATLPPRQHGVNTLTHVVAKTTAGLGVLDALHNAGAGFFSNVAPSPLFQALTGVGFAIGAFLSDGIMGASLAYDLVALSYNQLGQYPAWGKLLGAYAVGAAGITLGRNWK